MVLVPGVNSYISLNEASAYLAERLGAEAWSAASETAREQALREAFRTLERLPYRGAVEDPLQPAAWPRCGLFDRRGREWPRDAIPPAVAEAQCEEALARLREAADAGAETRAALQAQGVTEVRLGDVQERYTPPARYAGLWSREAFAHVEPFLIRTPRKVVMPV